jgi:hypothetical protein
VIAQAAFLLLSESEPVGHILYRANVDVTQVVTPYPVDFGGLWRTNRPSAVSGLNSKTTLVDSSGRSSFGLAVRRSPERLPPSGLLQSR